MADDLPKIGSIRLRPTSYRVRGTNCPVLEIILDDGGLAGNSLTMMTMEAITEQVKKARDRVVVITNQFKDVRNDRRTSFCGGLDSFDLLRYLARTGSCKDMLGCLKALYVAVASHPLPTVAWVDGNAAGGGVGLALCCDLIFVRRSIKRKPVTFHIPSGGYRELAAVLLPIIKWAHRRRQARRAGSIALSRHEPDLFIGSTRAVTAVGRPSWRGVVDAYFTWRDTRSIVIPKWIDPWPPTRRPNRKMPPGVSKEIDEAVRKANQPEAIRAIVSGLTYAVDCATERQLHKRSQQS